MTRRADLPRLGSRAYRVQELRELGILERRLYANDLARSAHGIVLPPGLTLRAEELQSRCLSLLPALREGHFFSKLTAAELWGMPKFIAEGGLLDVGSAQPNHAPRRPEIRGHRVRQGRVVVQQLRGLPVASPEDTWCLLGAVLPLQELVALGDFLISERRTSTGWKAAALSSPDRIRAAMTRHRGSRGMRNLVLAFPLLRSGVDSPAETQLRLIVVDAGIPEPVTNCPVPVKDGLLHADLGYVALKIAIEYEGQYHFVSGENQARKDVERWERMTDAGWRVLRVTARDLRDPAPFLARLARAIEAVKGAR